MNLLVIDRDALIVRSIQNALKNHFDDLEVFHVSKIEDATKEFIHIYNERHGGPEEDPSTTAADSPPMQDIPESIQLQFTIDPTSFEMLTLQPSPPAHFLGYVTQRLLSEPLLWKSLVDIDSQSDLSVFLATLAKSESTQIEFILRDVYQRKHRAKIQTSGIDAKDKTGQAVRHISIQMECALDAALTAEPPKARHISGCRVDVLIVSWECVGNQERTRIGQLRQDIAELNQKEAGDECICFVSAFEGAIAQVKSILATKIVDVIFKPLDALLFLQKLSVYVPKLNTGQGSDFLYVAETEIPVEIATEYSICGLSESGVQLRGKYSHKVGARVKMYSDKFGLPGFDGLIGSCFATSQNEAGHHISNFSFFGLSGEQIRYLRTYISAQRNKKTTDGKRPRPLNDEIKPPASVPAAERHQLALIDLDDETQGLMSSLIERYLADHKLVNYPSFKHFMRLLKPDFETDASEAKEAKEIPGVIEWETLPAFTSAEAMVILLIPQSLEFVGVDKSSTQIKQLFGHEVSGLAKNNDFWQSVLKPPDRLMFKDFLFYISSGQSAKRELTFINQSGKAHFIRVEGKLITTIEGPRLEIRLVDITQQKLTPEASPTAPAENLGLDKIRGVVLDYSFIMENPEGYLEMLSEALRTVTGRPQIPIFLTGRQIDIAALLQKSQFKTAEDIFFKPIDRGLFVRKVKAILDSKNDPAALLHLENYLPAEGWLDIAKTVIATGVSECGVQILFSVALPIGGLANIYYPILRDELGRGALSRCFKVEPFEKDFICHFMFLGVRDDKLKKIRLFLSKYHPDEEEEAG